MLNAHISGSESNGFFSSVTAAGTGALRYSFIIESDTEVFLIEPHTVSDASV